MEHDPTINDDEDESSWSTASEDDNDSSIDGLSDEDAQLASILQQVMEGSSSDGGDFSNDDDSTSDGGDTSDDGLSMNEFFRRLQNGNMRSCLYLRQGVGGIYSFPQDLPKDEYHKTVQKTRSICTTGCLTCVGVYIPIDDKRCFAAHIDGSIYKPLKNRDSSVWQITDDLAVSFRETVRTALDQTFQGMQQEVATIQQRQDLKDRAVVICTWPAVGQQTGPGFHIIDVLCDYFHLDKTKLAKYGAHHGFIVNHASKKPSSTKLVGWTRPGPSERVLDGISQIADNCAKPIWGDNFRSVFHTTYEYVMPPALGWMPRVVDEEEEKPWLFEYDHNKGSWYIRE